jgi:hypothetical protein
MASGDKQVDSNAANEVRPSATPSGVIYVEFVTADGVRPVSIFSRGNEKELAKKSAGAVDKAMDTIQAMANKVNSTIKNIQNRPNEVEVEFGIKFDAELGVIVAKASLEASIIVKLKWQLSKLPS